MNSAKNTYSLIAADADAICTTSSPQAPGALTMNGAQVSGGVVTLNSPQRVTVTMTDVDAGFMFRITGTDYRGKALAESIIAGASQTTTGSYSFKTITAVALEDGFTMQGSCTVGIAGAGEMPWIPVNPVRPYAYHVDVGSATFLVEGTLDDIQDTTVAIPNAHITIQASGTVDVGAVSTSPARGIRVKVTAFTSGNIIFRVLQP